MAGFTKAVREQVWIKTLLSGASGSGKSMSALLMAKGIAEKCGSRIAYIGTEGSRDKYYASSFDYDLLQLEDPFTIDKYKAAIDEAVKCGYKVIIIDSLTHEWLWLNDTHDKMPGNSFQNWGKLKPKHREFMDKILNCPAHIIATSRSKDEWVLETDSKGKQIPKKVGLGSQQDKNITYEYTVSLVIEQDTHVAHADKDNTGIFDGRYAVLTEKDGEMLYEWANEGEVPELKPEPQKFDVATEPDPAEELKELKKKIVKKCVELGGQKNTELMNTLKEYVPSGNPNAIRDLNKARDCIARLDNIKPIE